jgi:hypothetical protein
VRFYIYVSDAKLDMLYEQIPPKLLSRLAAELKVDLKVIGASVQQTRLPVTRYDKLHIVEQYLERNFDVSWMTDPAPWFRGDLGLRSAIYGEPSEGLLLFTGTEKDTTIALIGSSYHLVGRHPLPPNGSLLGRSFLPDLFQLLERDEAERADQQVRGSPWLRNAQRSSAMDEEQALEQVLDFGERARAPRQSCEFLSRLLLTGFITDANGNARRIVVGTPLYVALVEEQP